MKNILLINILFLFVYTSYSQSDTSIWSDLKTIKKDNYEVSAPKNWRELDMSAYHLQVYFEASGLAYPLSYNNSPFIVILCIGDMKINSLEDARESVQNGYSQNTDRVFPEDFKYESESVKLISGEDAYIINTRFYRKSKGLNQSRFDLVAYSEKYKTSYMYTISIQYSDPSYEAEKTLGLKDFARKVYSYFKFI